MNVKQYEKILLNIIANQNQNERMRQLIQHAIRTKIEDYCLQYLRRIKNESKKLLTCAQKNNKDNEMVIFLEKIITAKTFDELPEDMQDIYYAT